MSSSKTLTSQSGLSVIWLMKASMRCSRKVTPLLVHGWSPMARGKVVRPSPSCSIGRPSPGSCFVVDVAMINGEIGNVQKAHSDKISSVP